MKKLTLLLLSVMFFASSSMAGDVRISAKSTAKQSTNTEEESSLWDEFVGWVEELFIESPNSSTQNVDTGVDQKHPDLKAK